jgi:hypothetical protein
LFDAGHQVSGDAFPCGSLINSFNFNSISSFKQKLRPSIHLSKGGLFGFVDQLTFEFFDEGRVDEFVENAVDHLTADVVPLLHYATELVTVEQFFFGVSSLPNHPIRLWNTVQILAAGLFDWVSVLLFEVMIINFSFNVHRLVSLSLLEQSIS